ncbi:MAG: cyclic nucleotide-binding domain-containing protein [Paracoccaceae bacterium]|nr:cyclic nucleotide-binding domain-containing protein [Paracoccaceae bacterium]
MTPVYRSYKAGDIIYEAKENADSVFLIHTGEVDIVSNYNAYLATLGQGEMFGEISQILKAPRTVTVVARTSCVIRVIEDNVLAQKIEAADPAILAIMRGLALRLNATNIKTEALWTELQIYKSLIIEEE